MSRFAAMDPGGGGAGALCDPASKSRLHHTNVLCKLDSQRIRKLACFLWPHKYQGMMTSSSSDVPCRHDADPSALLPLPPGLSTPSSPPPAFPAPGAETLPAPSRRGAPAAAFAELCEPSRRRRRRCRRAGECLTGLARAPAVLSRAGRAVGLCACFLWSWSNHWWQLAMAIDPADCCRRHRGARAKGRRRRSGSLLRHDIGRRTMPPSCPALLPRGGWFQGGWRAATKALLIDLGRSLLARAPFEASSYPCGSHSKSARFGPETQRRRAIAPLDRGGAGKGGALEKDSCAEQAEACVPLSSALHTRGVYVTTRDYIHYRGARTESARTRCASSSRWREESGLQEAPTATHKVQVQKNGFSGHLPASFTSFSLALSLELCLQYTSRFPHSCPEP